MPTDEEIQTQLESLSGQANMMVVGDGATSQEINPDMVVAEGMNFSFQDMMKNGPTQPRRSRHQPVMTKNQLEEQKMNERAGYPSNLDEAEKVKKLEVDVQHIQAGIQQILLAMSGGIQPTPPQPSFPPVLKLHPTPTSPVLDPDPVGNFQEPNTGLGFVGMSEQQPRSPTVSELSTPLVQKTVRLSNGRVMQVGQNPTAAARNLAQTNLSMGPTDNPTDSLPAFDPTLMIEQPDTSRENGDLWVEEPPEPIPFKNDPKMEKLELTISRVTKFLNTRDPHLFFRRVLPKCVNRQVGYSAWPPKLKAQFDSHFKTLLSDPVFIRGQVATALSFEFGYGLSEQKIGELLVLSAGFLAFSLAGVETSS